MLIQWMKRALCATVFASTLAFTAPQQAHAQALEIVFKDSLWGAGIGSVTGLALWAWEDQETEDVPNMIVRGAAIGVFGGMIFGLYEVGGGGGGGGEDDMFAAKNEYGPSLLEYNTDTNTLAISTQPLQNIAVQRSRDQDPQLNVLRVKF